MLNVILNFWQTIQDGIILMAVGIGTVISFLIVLWAAISIQSVIIAKLNKICPEQVETAKTVVNKVKSDVEVAIAIAAAKLKG